MSAAAEPGTPVWLILSSAYVEQELAAEFGRLPPSFLPVGNRRLFEHQLEWAPSEHDLWLTLPEHFEVPPREGALLEEMGARRLGLPEGLTLGEAVIHACNLIGVDGRSLHILHGDTLVEAPIGGALDCIGVADASDGYSWAEVELDAGGHVCALLTIEAGTSGARDRPVACGYFAFSSAARLVRCIARHRFDFVAGVSAYARECPLAPLPVGAWHDFGHLRTFFRSRRIVSTQRAFNGLHNDGISVRKYSVVAGDKIRAESRWYATLPAPLRVYSARLIDAGETSDGTPFYETEYEYLPTLAEMYVFGTLDRVTWTCVLDGCREFLDACGAVSPESATPERGGALDALVRHKTLDRLLEFARASSFAIDAELRYDGRPSPSLSQIADLMFSEILWDRPGMEAVMHGDFCFSNILYNARMQRIRVIDPRGYAVPGLHSVAGDARYDLAKLGHSILGRYDQIIAGRYAARAERGDFHIAFDEAAHNGWVEAQFAEMRVGTLCGDAREIAAIIVTIFLSMLPLHADRPDRQMAFIANALRLFRLMDGGPA